MRSNARSFLLSQSTPRTALARASLVAASLSLALGACATPAEQLARAEAHYQNRAYGAAMANLENLGDAIDSMSRSERVRYDVARGLSHLNLNERDEARHWLALAREEAAPDPTMLTSDQRAVIERVMTETDPLAARDRREGADAGAAPSGAR